jgi:hypothetical protein
MAGTVVVKQVVAEMRAKTDQLDAALAETERRVKRTKTEVQGTGAAAGQSGQQFGNAARQIASASEAIARNGKVSGEAAKQILASGSQIAFAFGPAGAIVGALSIFGLAAVTAFRRAREEAEAANVAFTASLEKFRLARDYRGVSGTVVTMLQGDPEAESEAERLGLLRLRERVAQERAAIAASRPDPSVRQTAGQMAERRARIEGLRELEGALARLESRYAQAEQTFVTIAGQEQERLGNEKRTAAEEKAVLEGRAAVRAAYVDAVRRVTAVLDEFDKETAEFGKGFDRFVLTELATNAERVGAAFDELIAQGRRTVGSSDPRVQQLLALRDAAVSAASAIEASQSTIRDLDLLIASGGQPSVQTFQQLTTDAQRLTAQMATLKRGSKEYLAVQQQLLAVEQKRANLLAGVGTAPSAGSSARTTADLAREIQQAVDGALQLAAAFGAVDANALGALRSIAQIAGNIPALQTAIAAGGGLGILSAGLPILGAVASLIGEDPADAARREELRRNTEAIRELTAKAGLLGTGVRGGDARAAQDTLRDFLARSAGGSIIAGGRTYSASEQATIAAERLGILPELQRIAAQYGITLNRNITSFEQLAAALADTITKLGEFDTDLESQLKQADAEIRLRGITDPLEQLAIKLGALGGRSSAFDSLTAGLDLNTAEGRNAARANALALFDVLKAGGATLDAEALGGLSGDELLQALLDLIDSLNSADDALGITSGTQTEALQVSSNTQITVDQASRLLGLSASQLTVQREIRDLLTSALLASTRPIPLPSAGVLAGPASVGGTVTIMIENVFNGAVADPSALAVQQVEALTEHIRRALGQDVVVRQQYAGKVVS